MRIVPTGDRILAIVTEVTALGERISPIIIPDQAKEKKIVQAIVMDIGPKVDVDPKIEEGSIVLVNNFAGTHLASGEDELLLVASREVIAIVDFEAAKEEK
jgi:co-chaperonin GroES (HSP10)